MLKIRFKDNKYNAVWLVEPKITIGRSATNALVIDDPLVSDVHMEVLVDNEHLTLRNLVPTHAVIVNGQKITGACELKPGDNISIGAVELVVIDPKREARLSTEAPVASVQAVLTKTTGWSLKANHTALANRVFPLKDVTTIGRSNECDISLPAAHLSRRHAQLQVIDGMLFVKDLDSANGTFLNGKRVAEARVKRGDELRFDALSFGVMGPADDMAKTTVRKAVPLEPTNSPAASTARKSSPAARPAVATRASSVSRSAAAAPAKPVAEEGNKGKFGLILLAVLAIVVITTLILTRK
ncbi:FHA domain-containing protein [Cellvibrio sp. KY-YJ-3]|uniref:FHA domain-containing protein n=1 Tax=Cellvibrio sp. KY-YJ-3 TaxID=454662 RepID=UPI00124555B5|nr:FHA domain-containing protein [Cellvibrio sp. KY-YJ-3]QEY13059.1 FHA domain-containing protein [Cellvibrio sp. KY-YJ-3]